MLKNKWSLLLINLSLSTLLFFLFAPTYNLLHYINTHFYIGLVLLIMYLLMYTAKGGFFDGITFGFRRFHHVVLKKDDYLEEWKNQPLPSEKIDDRFYTMVRFQSLAFFSLLIILLTFYFAK